MTDFIFLGSKITADGGCSHDIKRCLLLGRKAMINLDSILKSRHHFASKGLYSQSYGFPSSHARMWELDHKEGWAPKYGCFHNCGAGKESWESLGFQGDQTKSSPKEIDPKYSLVGPKLKLKLQYLSHLMQRVDSLEKTLKLGKTYNRRSGQHRIRSWMASHTQRTWVCTNSER